MLGKKILFSEKQQRLSPSHFLGEIFEIRFKQSFGILFQCGIKIDALRPDEGHRPNDISGFLKPEIASNLLCKHPYFNSVPRTVFYTKWIHSIIFDFSLGKKVLSEKKHQTLPSLHFFRWNFSNLVQPVFWNYGGVWIAMCWVQMIAIGPMTLLVS